MYKVLLVDDEPVIIDGLRRVVDWDAFGCEVAGVAYDTAAGAAAIRALSPDILLTDIKMPGEDGLMMIAALKSEYPDMQVTVISGYSDFSYMQRAIALGVCRYILKPTKMAEIEEALHEMTARLDRQHPQPEEDDDKSASSFVVRTALSYIETHCVDKITLPDVAAQCYVSQWHLSKLLNRMTEKNFYDLLNEARIRRAKELLDDPKLRVSDICVMVGYTDPPHFSRIFKKLTGMSANEYRNRFAQ